MKNCKNAGKVNRVNKNIISLELIIFIQLQTLLRHQYDYRKLVLMQNIDKRFGTKDVKKKEVEAFYCLICNFLNFSFS